MGKITWVKLAVDLFDNDKIRYIRSLPEGNNIILIWVFLLTRAGRCNAGGMIFLTEDIPLDPEMLADLAGFDSKVVRCALAVFQKLGMINMAGNEDSFIEITNWEDYQSVDSMDRIREQNRERKKKQRERQKCIEVSQDGHDKSRDMSRDITQQNKNKKKEEEKDIEEEIIPPISPTEESESISDMLNRLMLEYSFSEPMQEKIREWIEYKDKRKEALTDISIKALLSRLQTEAQSYGDIRIIELIDESILNSWKNLQWKNLETMNNTTGATYMDSIKNRVDVVDNWV